MSIVFIMLRWLECFLNSLQFESELWSASSVVSMSLSSLFELFGSLIEWGNHGCLLVLYMYVIVCINLLSLDPSYNLSSAIIVCLTGSVVGYMIHVLTRLNSYIHSEIH
jgi:hypothetical protein